MQIYKIIILRFQLFVYGFAQKITKNMDLGLFNTIFVRKIPSSKKQNSRKIQKTVKYINK
jgi:hypothetical protein